MLQQRIASCCSNILRHVTETYCLHNRAGLFVNQPGQNFSSPFHAIRFMAGVVTPWMLSRNTRRLGWRFKPPVPIPFPPLPLTRALLFFAAFWAPFRRIHGVNCVFCRHAVCFNCRIGVERISPRFFNLVTMYYSFGFQTETETGFESVTFNVWQFVICDSHKMSQFRICNLVCFSIFFLKIGF